MATVKVTNTATTEQLRTISGHINTFGTTDHNKLVNKDLDNQHPISAITDLETVLNDISKKITAEAERAEAADQEIIKETTIKINELRAETKEKTNQNSTAIKSVKTSVEQEIARAEAAEQELNKKIDESSAGEVRKDLDAEIEKREQLTNEVHVLETELNTLTTNVTSLQKNVTTINKNIKNLGTEVQGLATNIVDAQQDISALQTTVANKQDKLIEGQGVKIIDNYISVDFEGTILDGGEIK